MTAFPLHLGDAADFARAARALRTPAFSATAVDAVLRGQGQSSLGYGTAGESPAEPTALLRLFISLEHVPQAEVELAIDRETLRSFLDLDLLRLEAGEYYSPVFVYPVGEFLIASDHYDKSLGADSVFPAIQSGTLQLLSLIPRTPVEDALDLCSGTGICGFAMSRHARRAAAADVSARCGHFAEFNRLLNACSNVEILTGDLYQPLGSRTFDRIVAHPPYVPSIGEAKIWRDAGSTGEAITRRVIQGLPSHLKPGGEFLAMCLGAEHENAPFQQRVREWLGEAESEFDVLCAVQKTLAPHELAAQLAGRGAEEDAGSRAEQLESAFREAGVVRFCHGALAIQRHVEPARSWTMRARLTPETRAESFEAVFRSSRACSSPEALPGMLLKMREGAKVTLAHRVEAGALLPEELTLETAFPFPHSIRLQAWLFDLLRRFDGTMTLAEIHQECGVEVTLEELIPLMAMLIIQGYLRYGDAT